MPHHPTKQQLWDTIREEAKGDAVRGASNESTPPRASRFLATRPPRRPVPCCPLAAWHLPRAGMCAHALPCPPSPGPALAPTKTAPTNSR